MDLAVDPEKHRMFAVLLWALRVPLVSAASRFYQSREPHADFVWEEATCLSVALVAGFVNWTIQPWGSV